MGIGRFFLEDWPWDGIKRNTFYELMALGPANPSLSKVQVTSDLIANGVGVAFAVWFAFRTDSVLRLVMREE